VQLCVFEQWCDPNCGAPTHLHAVKEVLTVLEGQAEVWIENEREAVTAGQSVIVPAGRRHGLRNTGVKLCMFRQPLAAPIFEASFDNQNEASRRWVPSAYPVSPEIWKIAHMVAHGPAQTCVTNIECRLRVSSRHFSATETCPLYYQ
jgi:hypothetical protein